MLFEGKVASVQVETDTVVVTSGFTRLVMNLRQAKEFRLTLSEGIDYLDRLEVERPTK